MSVYVDYIYKIIYSTSSHSNIFVFKYYTDHRDLHSFPTRRSSDLKPFSTTELHVRIKNLVESYHYQRKLSKQNTLLENTIDQLKETETQLVQTEKLASLGRMSAGDRKSTRLNSSHVEISYAVFCLK